MAFLIPGNLISLLWISCASEFEIKSDIVAFLSGILFSCDNSSTGVPRSKTDFFNLVEQIILFHSQVTGNTS